LREDAARYGHHSAKRGDHVLDLVAYGGVFLRLLENEVMDRIYTHFLGPQWTLYTYSSTILRPEVQQETKPASAIIHVDTSRFIPQYCTAMQMTLALDDFTDSNGTSLYLPGSHKCEEKPTTETFNSYAVKVTRNAGDALFWNPRVFHCSGINESNETRNALSTYAVRPYIKSRFDYPRMLAATDATGFSDRLRRILGFNSAPPANVEEFYCNGEARMQRTTVHQG
jgi:ectoine hydroxylase-related dioxygenase (phytanoyl-CoA dioxygenase family)